MTDEARIRDLDLQVAMLREALLRLEPMVHAWDNQARMLEIIEDALFVTGPWATPDDRIRMAEASNALDAACAEQERD